MVGMRLRGSEIICRRRFFVAICLALAAVSFCNATARAQTPAPDKSQAEQDLDKAKELFDAVNAKLQMLLVQPCLDKATRDKAVEDTEAAINQLGQIADTEGKAFIESNPPDSKAAEASVRATKMADDLQKDLGFLKLMGICGDQPPPPPGGGGITDGPVPPSGPIPPSRTEIPKCLTDWAKERIELLQKRIPEDEAHIKELETKMTNLRKEIKDLQEARAKLERSRQYTGTIDGQITGAMSDYTGLAWELRTYQIRVSQNKEDLEKLLKLKPCPDEQHGYYVPGIPGGGEQQYITYATDSTTHCTFTPGTFATILTTYFDDGSPGSVVPGPDTPPGSGAPPTDGPQTAMADRPARPDGKPTPAASPTPTTPPTTDITPAAPDDTPSEIPDDAELKVDQEVVEGGQTGQPLEGQTIKLLLSQKSDLPVPVDPKASIPARNSASDTKFDKSPNQCTTDANGGCKIQIATDDRPSYGLPSPRKGVHRTYKLAIARPQTSGGVAEITPGKDKIDPKALQSLGNKLASSTFKIGNRSFIRFALESKYGIEPSLAPKLKEAYGPSYEEDICDEKYPGGLSAEETPGAFGASEPELPGATISLRGEQTKRGVSR
jgi:hypothetical protein